MGPCRLLKTIFAQFLGKYRVVSALFGKIERLTFTGTFDAFQHLVKSHSFKQICFPHRSEMGVLKSFLISPETTKADIRAVRGPLTREAILKEGGKCPEIYGDPAIIMPRLYTPKIGAKHKAGLILHHTQETPTTHVLAKTCGFHQISIDRVRDEQLENFIDEVCSCQKIFSSSLHGIILAQAYGIPAQWIQITNTPIHRDANHKFADYFLGAGLPVQKPISIELTKESLSQLMQISPERVHISSDLIERLLEVFPFDIFPKK